MSIEIEFVTQVEYMLLASSVVIYSDASDIAAGACTVELKSKIFHKMWNSVEKVQSSTWREMKAIHQIKKIIQILPNPHDQLIYLYNQPFHFQIVESTECL
jgi:hypothetical protein